MESTIKWILAFMIGAGWSAANLYFTINILKISILKKADKKLSALILLKFPVLYLVLFLIFNSRLFPISGLLAGLMFALIAMGIFKLWPKQA